MGESIISVSTSQIKFTPLCKSASPKHKQEKFSKSPNLGPEVPDDASFVPGFADPSALGSDPPLAPSVPDSVRTEIRSMHAYIVDLFSQAAGSPAAPPPPRTLFEDFSCFYSSSCLPGLVCSCAHFSF